MQSEPNWAEVDGEAEMDYGTRPGLLPDLGPKIGGGEDPTMQVPETNDPAVRNFLNSLPNNGPYRIMITNLPQNITKESLESELSKTYKITAAIQFRPGQHYCFLKFNNRSHCLESTSLFGARIHGAAVKLKVNPGDQQAEIRRANTARNNSSGHSRATLSGSTGGRFKNLTRDGTSSRETKKHRHPVGGSIRKTKRSSNRNNQSSHTKPTNPWNSESRTQPKSDYKILPRGKQPTSTSTNSRFSRSTASSVSSGPSRREDTRAAPQRRDNFRDRRNDRRDNDSDGFRRNDRRDNDSDGFRRNDRGGRDRGDDAFNFRNNRGRKMREEDGRADDAMNWRRGGTTNKTIKRNTNPPPHAVTSDSSAPASSARPRVDRRDPVREPEADFSRRAMNSTQRKTNKKEKEEAEKSKNRFTNKFALLDEEDD